jgi:hypothetical protein
MNVLISKLRCFLHHCRHCGEMDSFAMRNTPYINSYFTSEERLDREEKEVQAQREWAQKLMDTCQRKHYLKWLGLADWCIARGREEANRQKKQAEYERTQYIPTYRGTNERTN